MSYRKIYERLEAHEPKELLSGAYWLGGIRIGEEPCGCVLGATFNSLRMGGRNWSISQRLLESAVAAEAYVLGITVSELARLQRANDTYDGTRAERYAWMMTWLEERIKEETP